MFGLGFDKWRQYKFISDRLERKRLTSAPFSYIVFPFKLSPNVCK
jgi:hypothetical protein